MGDIGTWEHGNMGTWENWRIGELENWKLKVAAGCAFVLRELRLKSSILAKMIRARAVFALWSICVAVSCVGSDRLPVPNPHIPASTSALAAPSARDLYPPNPLEERLADLTGYAATQCGSFSLTNLSAKSLETAVACVDAAVASHRAFQLIQGGPGIDSIGAHGVVGTTEGRVLWFDYDSAPCGGAGCGDRFETKACNIQHLHVVVADTIRRLTCEPRTHRLVTTGVVSATVVSTLIADVSEETGAANLNLLVLWRGTPGWLFKQLSPRVGAGIVSATQEDGRTITADLQPYSADVRLRFDVIGCRIFINDNEVRALPRNNVILVDVVDL